MMFKSSVVVALLSVLASGVSAQNSSAPQLITSPGPNTWWVANSQNVIDWECAQISTSLFTIAVTNSNPAILVSPESIIAGVSNSMCSILVTPQQEAFPAGSNYMIEFLDDSNTIIAVSGPFTIEPQGSAYPTTSSSAAASSTSSSSSASPSASQKSGAAPFSVQAASVMGAFAISALAWAF